MSEDQLQSLRQYECERKKEQRKKRKLQSKSQSVLSLKQESVSLIVEFTLGVLNQFEKQDKIEVMAEFLDDKHIQPLIREKSIATHMHTSVISALKSSLQVLKVPKCNDELFMKRGALTLIANGLGDQEVSLRRASEVLGIHPRNLYLARERLQRDGTSSQMHLKQCQRQPRNDFPTSEIKELVVSFWTAESRVSPNKKDICRQRIGPKLYEKHPIHLLDDSQVCN